MASKSFHQIQRQMKVDLVKISVFVLALLMSITGFYMLQDSNNIQHHSPEFSLFDREDITSQTVYQRSSLRTNLANGEGDDRYMTSYIHCGTTFSRNTMNPDIDLEIMLLHGAAFRKEDWATSGILDKFCLKEDKHISITALDLSVKADSAGLVDTFEAFVHAGILSGHPVIWITPSASGKAIVDLASDAYDSKNGNIHLKTLVRTWIPVASPSVLSVNDYELFGVFSATGIKVLSIHGDQDQMGKKVTSTLENYADAKGVQLKGRHSCYLDSPDEFVNTVYEFLRG